MDNHDEFITMSGDEANQYAEEAKQRWGTTEVYKQSMERAAKMTPADVELMRKKAEDLIRAIAAKMNTGAKSSEVQELIAVHYDSLRTFYEPNPDLYRGLAEMYVADERFKAHYEAYAPGMAEFMRDAMCEYCEKMQGA